MAKSGIDYFPLDVVLDAKFELIEAEFGLTGFGVVVHLLQEIYGKAGYYIEWTEEVALLFARKVGLGGSVGEFLAARNGLGYLIIYSSQVFKMDWLLMSIVLLCIMAMGLYALINLVEKLCKKRF